MKVSRRSVGGAVVVIAALVARGVHRRTQRREQGSARGSSRASTSRGPQLAAPQDPRPGGQSVLVRRSGSGFVVRGTVLDGATRLADVRVAVADATPPLASTTDAIGTWELTVPSAGTSYIRWSKTGLRTGQAALDLRNEGTAWLPMDPVDDPLMTRILDSSGVREDPAAGVVVVRFSVRAGGTWQARCPAGFAATLSSGGTPVAAAEGGARRSNATLGGEGVVIFLNAPVGEATLEARPPSGYRCVRAPGVPGTLRIDPGVITFTAFDCQGS